MEPINISEVERRLSEFVSRASAGKRLLIGRRERPLAVLLGTNELERIERASRAGRLLAGALDQSTDLPELDDLAEEICANRGRQPARRQRAAVRCP